MIFRAMTSRTRLYRRPAPLALAVMIVASACAPAAHVAGTPGGDAETLVRIADNTRANGDLAAALPIYRRAHALAPLDPVPLLRLGETLNRLGAWREAGEAWSQVLRTEPRNPDALAGYATTLTALGQPGVAIEYWNRSLAERESAEAYNGLGVASDMAGLPDAAQLAYRAGLARHPGDPRLANNLGVSLALSGRHAEAIGVLEEAAAHRSAGAALRQNLVMAYALSGDTGRALEIGRRDLDDLTLMRNLGWYDTLAAMDDHAEKVAAIGTHRSARYEGAISTANIRTTR